MAKIRVYLAQQPSNRSLYEVYREGKPTGELWDTVMIQKMLTPGQYKSFLKDGLIFLIEGEQFRTRNHKTSSKKARTNINLNL